MRHPKFPIYCQNRASGQARSVKHCLLVFTVCIDGLSLQKENHLKWQIEISAFFSLERDLTAAELVLPGVEPQSISQGLLGALDLGLLQRGGRAGLGGEPDFSAQFMSFSACL